MEENNKSIKVFTPEEVLENNGYSIEDLNEEGTILFRNPDYSTAIIGVTEDNRVVYDYDKMVEFLVNTKECESYEEAADFVSYDTIRSLYYINEQKLPIVMYSLVD